MSQESTQNGSLRERGGEDADQTSPEAFEAERLLELLSWLA